MVQIIVDGVSGATDQVKYIAYQTEQAITLGCKPGQGLSNQFN